MFIFIYLIAFITYVHVFQPYRLVFYHLAGIISLAAVHLVDREAFLVKGPSMERSFYMFDCCFLMNITCYKHFLQRLFRIDNLSSKHFLLTKIHQLLQISCYDVYEPIGKGIMDTLYCLCTPYFVCVT